MSSFTVQHGRPLTNFASRTVTYVVCGAGLSQTRTFLAA